ncbi:MAG: VWA domain-containing protein [Deltaproteobacteria bacterium]|nr:VWA domain-containing protein [Deltaproteobacteria bacterium]
MRVRLRLQARGRRLRVSPQKRNELGLSFKVLENGADIGENVESYATVIPKPVESYVTLVIDVSDSITGSQDFPALVDQLRLLLTQLTPEDGGPEVYVSVYVFGRDVAEYVPFTRDFGTVDSALDAAAVDPTPVVMLAGNGNGTDLFDAVETGIKRTQRIRDLREIATDGGVLSTGTVVVVTDGKDTSNGMLDTNLVEKTTNNVISIGISNAIDDADLQRIGRDGSFLAPTAAEWPAAFAEIAERVAAYPSRSYLLAYCSSATEGDPEVEVEAVGPGIHTRQSAVCKFDADRFGTDAAMVCDALLFATECSAADCSGLTACGACADDQCCVDGVCLSPLVGSPCFGQDDLCAATDQVCGPLGACTDWAPLGGPDCGDGCQPEVGFCNLDSDPATCVPVRPLGDECDAPQECSTLNCTRVNEDNPLEAHVCRERALLYDFCGTDEAICEPGGYCETTCKPKKVEYESCSGSDACRSSYCVTVPDAGNLCDAGPACFWSWDEKVPN